MITHPTAIPLSVVEALLDPRLDQVWGKLLQQNQDDSEAQSDSPTPAASVHSSVTLGGAAAFALVYPIDEHA